MYTYLVGCFGVIAALITCTSTWMELSGKDNAIQTKDVERFDKIGSSTKTKKLWAPVWRLPGIFHYVNRFKSTLLLNRCLYKK